LFFHFNSCFETQQKTTTMNIDIGQVFTLLHTIEYAVEKHGLQQRKNSAKKPYMTHPLSVAQHLIRAEITDLNVLRAAILHDVPEDTKGTLAEIEAKFGAQVAGIVAEVTDDKSLPAVERKQAQIEHAKTASYEAKLVKLADKLDNLLSLQHDQPTTWSLERVQGYMVWSQAVVASCAGTCPNLEGPLRAIFRGDIVYKGSTYPAIPSSPSHEEQLQNYYALLN